MNIKQLSNIRFTPKGDIESNWNKAIGFIPLDKEIIIYKPDETYTSARIKVGDGKTTVQNLPFIGTDMGAIESLIDEKGELLVGYVDDAVSTIPEIQHRIDDLEGRITYISFNITTQNSVDLTQCKGITKVDWGDGTVNSELTHIYQLQGNYLCKIYDMTEVKLGGSDYFPNAVQEVVLSKSVKTISDYAFSQCSNLKAIIIPDSVTSVGKSAFYFTNLKNVVIPNSVVSIGKGAFASSGLNEIVISDSVASIDEGVFRYCFYLTSVVIPDSVTSIGNGAFYSCSSLTEIVIPDSVTSIGEDAFRECNNLTSVVIGDSVKSIGEEAFRECSSLTSVVIPDSVTSIGLGAFWQCSRLEEITLPFVGASKDDTSNTHFGYIFKANTYWDNSTYVPTSLKKVTITSATSIGFSAFYDCDSLTSVEIGDSVTSIGYSAFYHCSSLTDVVIGNGVTRIDEDAFSNCSSLTGVYITDIEAWCNIFFVDSYANPLSYAKNLYLNNKLVENLMIPDSVTSIGELAFTGCSSLTSVEIGDSVTKIGRGAFNSCTNLKRVLNGKRIISIGYSAFSGCSSLTTIKISNSVTWIDYEAFYKCSSLTSIKIPDSVTNLGGNAFSGCDALTTVTCQGAKPFGYLSQFPSSSLTTIWVPQGCSKAYKDGWADGMAPQSILDLIKESSDDREAYMSDLAKISTGDVDSNFFNLLY